MTLILMPPSLYPGQLTEEAGIERQMDRLIDRVMGRQRQGGIQRPCVQGHNQKNEREMSSVYLIPLMVQSSSKGLGAN